VKRLLNTLFVTTQGAYLNKEGETVVVSVNHEVRLRLPILTLSGIVCFGNVTCSPFLLGFCGEKGVGVSFLSEHGHFLARVYGPVSGNVLLRREQFRRAESAEQSADLAAAIVAAKVANGRTVLRRALRDHGGLAGEAAILAVIARLDRLLDDVRRPLLSLDALRGLEGEAAAAYFGVFDHLIVAQKDAFQFRGRSRRPPMDPVNAVLSFLYTLLAHDAAGALEAVGLDPQVGFLHAVRPGRPSLALDLLEELRPVVADRLALSLINLKQVQGDGFRCTETGGVEMSDDTRKALLIAYQKRKQEEVTHPFLGETVPVGMLLHAQALLLARYLRGDLDAYPPFVWR
jgi:CRISPR-associated protein Cas1